MKRSGFLRTRSPKTKPKDVFDSDGETNTCEGCVNPVKPLVRGVYGPAQLTAAPKTVEHRNEDLLRLARGRQCLFRLLGICNNDPATVVACHSNSQDHGKAAARKADDQWSAWGCYACHSWLDAGKADYRTKNRAFSEAHLRQQEEWAKIAYDMSEKPKDRRAAEWALLLLNPPQ